MRIATLAIFLLAALSFSQCPCLAQVPTATPRAQATPFVDEAEVRKASGEYLTALGHNDWAKVSALTYNGEDNSWLGLTQDLLRPLEIERLSFELQDVSLSPWGPGQWQASARYTMSIRATDPQTHEPAIELTNLKRVITLWAFKCDCPPRNLSEWKIGDDEPDLPDADMMDALAGAKTTHERRLLMLGSTKAELEKLATNCGLRGYKNLLRAPDAEAFKWLRLNQLTLGQAKYDQSFELLLKLKEFEKDLDRARAAKDVGREAFFLHLVGIVYLKLGRYEEALKYFNDSLKLAGKTEEAAEIYESMGITYAAQGDDARAISCLEKSLERYRTPLGGAVPYSGISREELFRLRQLLAFLYEAEGRDELVQRTLREMLEGVGKGSEEEAGLLHMIGSFYNDTGNVVKAIEYFEKAVKVAGQLDVTGDLESESNQRLIVGASSFFLFQLYLERHDYTKAARHLSEARKAWKGDEGESDEKYDYIFPMLETTFYESHGDKALAGPRKKQFINILTDASIEGAGQGAYTFDVLNLFDIAGAELYSKQEFKAARERFELLLRLAEEDGDEFLIAQTYQRIAATYSQNGEPRLALENLEKSLQVLERVKPSPVVPSSELRDMAWDVRFFIGIMHRWLGEEEQALARFRQLLGVRGGPDSKLEKASILYQIADIHFRRDNYDEALEAAREALALIKADGSLEEIWKFYTQVGQIQRALKRYKLAARSFNDAIAEIEASRSTIIIGEQTKQRFFEDKLGPYHEMVGMLVEQNKCEEALGYAERSKSRVLLDALRGGRQDIQGVTGQESERERVLRGSMVEAERQFASAQAEDPKSALTEQLRAKRLQARWEFETFRAELMQKYYEPRASRKVRAGALNHAGIAALLPRGGAALEYVVTEKRTYLFVQTGKDRDTGSDSSRARCVVHTIPVGSDELKKRVVVFNQRVAHPEGVVRPLARELYDLLLGPARAELAGRPALLIVPDSYLWSLPFQALLADDGEYLLQRSAVAYAPSLTTLAEMRKVAARWPDHRPKLLALANPRPPDDGAEPRAGRGEAYALAPLPQTEEMALRLEGLYGRERSKVYTRADADERHLKDEAPQADVIHIGAHGFLDDDNPMYSRLVLSRVGRAAASPSVVPAALSEDGVLEAWELMDMRLRASLVVLSACETARGRVGDGEGVVGLSWALFMAGVPSTVVSQWKVDEGSTSRLLYGFHESLVRGGGAEPTRPRKAEALRRASLKLLGSEAYRHPYYWAGFILIGDGN